MTAAQAKGHKKTNLTTLCYIEQDGKYLMMHRVKKAHDINNDKWIGVGGHFEPDERAEVWLLREGREEYMFLYTADAVHGALVGRDGCREGTLEWVAKDAVYELPIWEGDKIFFRLMEQREAMFSLKLRYVGDKLVEKALDGRAF